MKVNEIEINGKIYRVNYIKDSDNCNICEHCDLQSYCESYVNEDALFKLCQENPFKWCFKEIKQKENINIKFYRFSTGTVFHVNHIKDIIDIVYVEKCPMEPNKYSFSILMSNSVTIHVRFDTKAIATRERNKFIKFIEEYETLD